jgi:N utilization substance protein B
VPSRRKTREFVLQVLFAADAQSADPLEFLPFLQDHFLVDDEQVLRLDRVMEEFAQRLLSAVAENKDAIDELISRQSHNWKIYRMNKVDRNILRMAIAELVEFPDIPPSVTMNEAIDLGKRYGAEHSAAFVNGILDQVCSIKTIRSSGLKLKDILESLDESDTTD